MEDEKAGLRINTYKLLVKNPDSTFFLQTGGDSPEFGISEGDYIVVDRQTSALDGKLVIASLNGELRIMKLKRTEGIFLESGGKSLEITGREHVFIWGVVRWVLKEM